MMNEKKCFQVLSVSIPDNIKYCCYNGIHILKYGSQDVLVSWQGSNILLSKTSIAWETAVNFDVLTVDNTVQDVFQVDDAVYCLDVAGILYTLQRAERPQRARPKGRRMSSSDIFQSSSDHDSDEEQQPNAQNDHFKPISRLLNTVCIHPISHGFVLVKRNAGKLYVEAFKTNGRKVEKKFSQELCHDTVEATPCVIMSRPQKDFSPSLVNVLLKDGALLNVEVVFVGTGRGLVYYVPVTQEGSAVFYPKLLYRAVDRIAGILCLPEPGGSSALTQYLAVVLHSGPTVFISYDAQKKVLHYEMAYLLVPCRVVCAVGATVFVGDGVELWCCPVAREEEEGVLTLRSSAVGVRGVQWLSAVPGTNHAIAATVHGTFYSVHSNVPHQPSVVPTVSKQCLPDISVPLTQQLQELARLKQELVREEELMAGVNVTLRAELLRGAFILTARVYDFEQEPLSSIKESCGNFKGKISDTNDRYMLKIDIENMSDQEFSPSIWSIHISMRTNCVAVEKSMKLEHTFKKGVPYHGMMCVFIDDPSTGVEVSCALVCELPDDDEVMSPWLIIPVACKWLDVTHFLTPSFVSDARLSGSDTVYKTLLPVAQENNRKTASKATVVQRQLNKEHCCAVKIPQEVRPHEIWAAIFKHCLHRCSREIKEWCEESPEAERDIHVYVGCNHVVLALSGSNLTLRGQDMKTLHVVKTAVTSSLAAVLGASSRYVSLENTTVSRALEFQDKIQVEKSLSNLQAMKIFKTVWRNFVAENIPL